MDRIQEANDLNECQDLYVKRDADRNSSSVTIATGYGLDGPGIES
jgi:hypothetical protein